MTSSKRSPSTTNLPAIIDLNKWHNWPESGPTIHIRYVPPETLKPPKRQLRKHSKKQLGQIEASLRRFGFTNPIQVDADNRIVAGVGRWQAALARLIHRGSPGLVGGSGIKHWLIVGNWVSKPTCNEA